MDATLTKLAAEAGLLDSDGDEMPTNLTGGNLQLPSGQDSGKSDSFGISNANSDNKLFSDTNVDSDYTSGADNDGAKAASEQRIPDFSSPTEEFHSVKAGQAPSLSENAGCSLSKKMAEHSEDSQKETDLDGNAVSEVLEESSIENKTATSENKEADLDLPETERHSSSPTTKKTEDTESDALSTLASAALGCEQALTNGAQDDPEENIPSSVPEPPGAIRMTRGNFGIKLQWENPPNDQITQYSLYLAVRTATSIIEGENRTVTSTSTQTVYLRIYFGTENYCIIDPAHIANAHISDKSKPEITFRIVARNQRGFGPLTQVRWLQDTPPENQAENQALITKRHAEDDIGGVPAKQPKPDAQLCGAV